MIKKILNLHVFTLLLICNELLFFSSSIHAMLTPTRSAQVLNTPRIATKRTQPTIQKRTVSTPEQLKQFTIISQAAKKVSPAFGAAKYTSGSLQRMYALESQAPAVQLVQELFNQLGPLFRPTASKSKAAYALTPSVLGLVIGALETSKINDPQARKEIIELWRTEYKNITNGDKMSKEKINNLLTLIDTAYQQDREHTLSILLGFLYAKANPDNNHDMLHYLFNLKKYIPIFESEEVSTDTIPSFTKRFTSDLQQLSSYDYTPQEYASLQRHFIDIPEQEAVEIATQEKFEETIATIIDKPQRSSSFPPQVILTEHGYQGKPTAPNCVEAAIHDLFNIILYNSSTHTFDMSLLPATLQPNEDFKRFYELQSNIKKINSPKTTQAFMNMVSGIKEIQYVRNNYELETTAFEKNLFILFNHFFQTQVDSFDQLAKALSDEHRAFSFVEERDISTQWGNGARVFIEITNHQTGSLQIAILYFTDDHSWIDVPERSRHASEHLLNTYKLAKEYTLSPQAQALFSIQSDINVLSFVDKKMPISFYYNFKTNTNNEKTNIIEHIANYNSNDSEAIDYAYALYQQLSPHYKIFLLPIIMKNGLDKVNKNFENIYLSLTPETTEEQVKIINAIILYNNTNQEAVDYAYKLFIQLPRPNQLNLVNTILKSGVHLTNNNFKNLYPLLTPKVMKKINKMKAIE